jgi:hypothetical protein
MLIIASAITGVVKRKIFFMKSSSARVNIDLRAVKDPITGILLDAIPPPTVCTLSANTATPKTPAKSRCFEGAGLQLFSLMTCFTDCFGTSFTLFDFV